MRAGQSIPEMLGFAPIPSERRKSYSRISYQAQYCLLDHEADELLEKYGKEGHKDIHRELSLRYARDPEYRRRIAEWRQENVPERVLVEESKKGIYA